MIMTKEIHIAQTLARKRKEKGITQEELARFMGVSKASVSKWETGNSYPDVVFLPQLAAYFNISLDELMGYEPQMTDKDIRALYMELIGAFAAKPLDEVLERCRAVAKKYYACFPLLYQIAVLLLNYSPSAQKETQTSALLAEAKSLFVRVKELSDNIELRRLALQSEALCEMMCQNPQNVVMLLENESRHWMQPSIETLLSQAHRMLGNRREAEIISQGSVFDAVVSLFYEMTSHLSICADDGDKFEAVCQRALALEDLFGIKMIFPLPVLSFYLTAAEGYVSLGNTDRALVMLENYTQLAAALVFPLGIQNDDFFPLLKEAREKQMAESSIIMPELPRDEQAMKREMVSAVVENPAFSALSGVPRYESLAGKLNIWLRG